MSKKIPSSPGKYLVCVAQNEESRIALRFACIKAKKRGGKVGMIHVTEPADVQTLFAVADKMNEERREEAESLMHKLAKEAHDSTGVMPSITICEGTIGEEIINAAIEDHDANMLVLGVASPSSNHGKLIAWIANQLSSKILIPMMLVPGNLTDQQMEELS
jgi:nucleotide-binding universal stress UspA family protein